MDEELLAEARRAQERLIEAEHDAETARADFHRAVRRLHLSGGSLRGLAPALGLSHQRVHQIVEAAGGSRRWGRRRSVDPDPECTFCGHRQSEGRRLVAGPGVHICEACAVSAAGVLAAGGPSASKPSASKPSASKPSASKPSAEPGLVRAVPAQEQRERCSFCGKYRPECAGLAASARAAGKPGVRQPAICAECLALCAEIFAERLA
jgi:hypothetical protein